jgi:hypothetical protein
VSDRAFASDQVGHRLGRAPGGGIAGRAIRAVGDPVAVAIDPARPSHHWKNFSSDFAIGRCEQSLEAEAEEARAVVAGVLSMPAFLHISIEGGLGRGGRRVESGSRS